MQYVWAVLALMVAVIAIGSIVCFRLIKNKRQKKAAIAAFGYLAFAAALFYIDVVQLEQSWAVPIYIACFIAVPLAVYYVVYSLAKTSAENTKPNAVVVPRGPSRSGSESDSSRTVAAEAPFVVDVEPAAAPASGRRPPAAQKAVAAKSALPDDENKRVFDERVQSFKQQAVAREQRIDETEKARKATQEKRAAASAAAHEAARPILVSDSEKETAVAGKRVKLTNAEAPTSTEALANAEAPLGREVSMGKETPARKEAPKTEQSPMGREASTNARFEENAAAAAQPIETKQAEAEKPSEPSAYEAYRKKAISLKEKGHAAIAAKLFAESAAVATDGDERKRSLFDEITSYIAAGDKPKAHELARSLRANEMLTSGETAKADALLIMLSDGKAG